MSFIRRALETRAGNPENPNTRLTGQVLIDILENNGRNTVSGKKVTPESAMKFVAVYRAVTMLAGLAGAIPLKGFKDVDGVGEESIFVPILEEPAPGYTKFLWREQVLGHLLTHGNFDAFRVKDETGVRDLAWLPYRPGRVKYERERPHAGNPSGRLFEIQDDDGHTVAVLTSKEILHIPLFSFDGFKGLSPIGMAREAIASGQSAEDFANKLWSSGTLAAGILTTDKRIDDQQAKSLKRRWKERVTGINSAYDIAVMDAGAKFQQLTIPPQEAQFMQSRVFTITEIARLYGLPPHLLSHLERQTSWGTGIEQHNIGFVAYTLQPVYLARIEQEITRVLREDPGWASIDLKVEYQLQALMRGDSNQRSLFYERMTGSQLMTPNEVRKLENLPPVDGGDEMIDVKTSPSPAAEEAPAGDDDE